MHKTKISKEEINKCYKFAKAQVKGSYSIYKYRNNGTSPSKVIRDITIGKIAEIAVCKALGTTSPDFNIYPTKQKSHDADLHLGSTKIHVKSFCTTGWIGSWVYDKKCDTEGLHALCEVKPTSQGCIVSFWLYRACDIQEWFMPTIKQQKGKVAVYQRHLQKYCEEATIHEQKE
jgi:hypothetical protein